MTDSQAKSLGTELLKLTGDDPLEADDDILISLGRAARKLAEPYVLEGLRDATEAQIRAVDAAAHERWPNAREMAIAMQRALVDTRLSEIKGD